LDARIIAALISAAAMIIVAVYEMRKSKKSNKTGRLDLEKWPLTNHPVFSGIELLCGRLDYKMNKKSTRKILARDVFCYYILTIKEVLYEFAEKAEELYEEGIDFSFHEMHMRHLNEIQKRFKNLDNFPAHLNEEDKKTVNMYLQKFNEKNEENIKSLINRSLTIAESHYFNDDKIRIAILFDAYLGILTHLLNVEKQTLQELDGELDGLIYKENNLKKQEEG